MPLSLRAVVSTLAASLVVIAVAITFCTTYFTTVDTVQDLGLQYASSVLDGARFQTESYFNQPATRMTTFGKMMKTGGYMLPSDDPTMFDVLDRFTEVCLLLQVDMLRDANSASILFDDGSRVSVWHQGLAGRDDTTIERTATNAVSIPAGDDCCATLKRTLYYASNLSIAPEYLDDPTVHPVLTDGRIGAYQAAKPLLAGATKGSWFSPLYVDSVQELLLPVIQPLNNGTAFLGLGTITYSLGRISEFLASVRPTPNSHLFATDSQQLLLASTHPTPFQTTRMTTNRNEKVSINCISSALTADSTATEFTIACRSSAVNFVFAPLQAAAQDPELIAPKVAVTKMIAVPDSEPYIAAAAPVDNLLSGLNMRLIVLIPESDIMAEIHASRDVALGIVAGFLVFAVLLAFVVVNAVLAPLATVASQLNSTARLREVDADESRVSAFKEISELQRAYFRMNTAMRSFTRYVPRDVVKDLIASGELCHISMTPTRCTILFADIAGFTSMCERVPTEELSRLITVYFERMSHVVMEHGGVIDKFIGDCVMAFWGAPNAVPDQEVRAALTAVGMQRETRQDPIASAFDAAGEMVHVRIGLASGTVLAGNMGSSERMSYTVIGDHVNLAARCEALCKRFGVGILAAEDTVAAVAPFLVTRKLQRVAVVGKEVDVRLYEIVGVKAVTADAFATLRADMSSDTASVYTVHSTVSARQRRDDALPLKRTHNLIEAAQRHIVPAPIERYCEYFNTATQLHEAGNSAEAIARLNSASVECPADIQCAQFGSDLPTQDLRERCEKGLQDPSSVSYVLNIITK
jgi:class 3 adenylate cyclase